MKTTTTTRTFHCTEAGASKFWTIATTDDGKTFTVTFGKIGTAGQTKEKSFPTAEACAKETEKLIREKTGKGYIEQGVSAAASTAAKQTATPAAAPKKSSKPAPKLPPYDERDTKHQRAFLRAIRAGSLEKIRTYIESGARLHQMIFESKMDSTFPFLAALENPQPEIIRYFLTLPNYHPTYTGNNQSVLTSIATDYELSDADRLAKVEHLLECGYDCSCDEYILIQLPNLILPEELVHKLHDRASRARDTGDVIFEALQYGGEIRCNWISTPWKPAPIARLLWMLDHGLQPNFTPSENNEFACKEFGSTLHTVLHLCSGNEQLIKKLLEKGANPLARDKNKLTPWEYAETARSIPPAVIALLRKAAESTPKE